MFSGVLRVEGAVARVEASGRRLEEGEVRVEDAVARLEGRVEGWLREERQRGAFVGRYPSRRE
jgi:hypothetical protein